MRINNIGEFKTFLTDNNLENIHSDIANFAACVSQYNLICSCKRAQKNQKFEICNQQYINVVSRILPEYKHLFIKSNESIEFYYNQVYHIITLSF